MKRKLKNSRGETLVEVLAAILVSALSIALLFSAVTASASMDNTARKTDDTYKEILAKAEMQDGSGTFTVTDKVTVANTAPGGASKPVDVTFYGGDGALSYKIP